MFVLLLGDARCDCGVTERNVRQQVTGKADVASGVINSVDS